MVPGPGQTHLLYGTMKLVKLGQMSRSITEYFIRELIFTKIFVKLVSWKILVVARLICTLLIPSHIIFFTDLLLSANQFACDLFCKNKFPHPTKKNRISLTEDTLVLMPCDAGNKLKNCTQIWPKKLVFFLKIMVLLLMWNLLKWWKKIVLFDKEDFENHCAVISYPELYWNLLWELWDMLCPAP